MSWPWEIAERDHDLQNPTSRDKIRLVGEYLRLGPTSRVLDIACGKDGPAYVLAASFGCRISGIELRPAVAEAARGRRWVESLIDVVTADASAVPLEREAFDAALCLGATFVWGTIRDAAAAVRPAVRCDGFVAIGEPYWRQWPLPDQIDADGFVGLSDTVGRFEGARFAVTGIVGSSEDDWDRYESLHWRAIEEWLTDHPDGAGAAEVRAQHERFRGDYIGFKRALLGWAIFVGRKR